MIRTGDWVVPRQQGEPFLSRPPLGSWLIAGATLLRGQCDAVAIRLPSVTAVLLMTLMTYAFGRTVMGRAGAFTAGVAIATMGEVMQMGRLGESDIVFAFLLSAAGLVWLWGDRRGWPDTVTWTLAYGLVALAALQKGPQAPVCFFGTVVAYLLRRGEWRRLVSPAHLVGLGTIAAIVAAWAVPFVRAAGGPAAARIWLTDSTSRFWDLSPGAVTGHLVRYPVEVLGCTAPWSLLLFAYLNKRFRRGLGAAESVARFLAIGTCVGFLPCWVAPTGMTRYLLPLYPGLALLAGLVVDRAAVEVCSPRLVAAAAVGRRALIGLMLLSPAALAAVPFLPSPVVRAYAAPLPVLLSFTAVGITAAWIVTKAASTNRWAPAAAAVSVFMAVAYGQVVVDGLVRRSGDTAAAVAQLKQSLPPGVRLVSLTPIHHLFAYHFGEPIELRDTAGTVGARDMNWFCCSAQGAARMPVPFPREIIAVIPVDRNRLPVAHEVVVVGRRTTAATAMTAEIGREHPLR
jgi:4-amino-4-deoxy-L-arabinose transferase-like glycosyltransferase